MKIIVLLIALIIVPELGFSQAMSEERSKCYTKEAIADDHEKWKTEFQKFLNSYGKYNTEFKYDPMTRSLDLILGRINNLKGIAKVSPSDPELIKEALRLREDIQSKRVTPEQVVNVLKPRLGELSQSLDTMLKKAQELDPDCKILKTPLKSDKVIHPKKPVGTS